MGEKTEKASPKKLKDARKKGQVAKSQDMPSVFTFIASIWAVLSMSQMIYHRIGGFLVDTFHMIDRPDLPSVLGALYEQAAIIVFMASIPILAVSAAIGVLINFVTVGPIFSTEVFKFDIKKFDPIQNLKGKFKVKTLVELLKSVVKISVASYLIYLVVYNSLPILIKTVGLPISTGLVVFVIFLKEVVLKVGLFFFVIAVADFAYQKYSFANDMKMEKFEVKQEYKNSEGDPHIKGKRRQIAQEIAFGEGPAGGVKGAKAVVTNPTHLAIAIDYDRETDPAPSILAMGEGILATQMISLAKRYQIPIVQNIPLAHKLWDEGEVYEFIPEGCYEAVAEILRWIAALNTENEYDYRQAAEIE